MSSPTAPAGSRPTWSKWLREHGFAELFRFGDKEHLPDMEPTFDPLEWNPVPKDRTAAWKLLVQLRTRIVTEGLAYRAGDEATALKSVHDLFGVIRSILEQSEGATHFATLTITVLNHRIRPFTAQWHKWMVNGYLDSADGRRRFRSELDELRVPLSSFSRLLALLAEDPLAASISTDPALSGAVQVDPPSFGGALDFGIEEGENGKKDPTIVALNAAERKEVLARRGVYLIEGVQDAVGLAISGGGIRSATFGLGVVEVLARRGILRHVDFLSTVSGGGYLGSFLSSYLSDSDERINLKPEATSLPFGALNSGESPAVRHLRNHSKYLAEGGWWTIATSVSLVLYGLFTAVLLMAPLFLALNLLRYWIGSAYPWSMGDTLLVLTGVLLLLGIIFPIVQKKTPRSEIRQKFQNVCVGLASVCLIGGLYLGLSRLEAFEGASNTILYVASLFPVVVGICGLWLGAGTKAGNVVLGLMVFATPLLLWALSAFAGKTLQCHPEWLPWALILTILLFFYSSYGININFVSPHLFYRNRLAQGYLVRRNGDEVRNVLQQPLSEMNPHYKAPYHLINGAWNIPASKNVNLRGRNSDFFVFSKAFCGSAILKYKPTKDWEKEDSHLDLGTAMAISAAAAAPNMGSVTLPRYTALLTLMNIRLGYWLRKPGAKTPLIGWQYFLLELTRQMTEDQDYANVSDGGHIENLGIYELLRRRCRFIIAVDGEADPQRTFGGLLTLTRMAEIDLGTQILPDLSDLKIDAHGIGKSHFILSEILYPQGAKGYLLYIKTSLTGNESEFIQKYKAEHPEFPHQSTAQQLFDETRFEAYRALGEHAAEDLFQEVLAGPNPPATYAVNEWFKQLANRLLYRG